jgi:hypothetical protein
MRAPMSCATATGTGTGTGTWALLVATGRWGGVRKHALHVATYAEHAVQHTKQAQAHTFLVERSGGSSREGERTLGTLFAR